MRKALRDLIPALALLGAVLYRFRDRSLTDGERVARILGGGEKGDAHGEKEPNAL